MLIYILFALSMQINKFPLPYSTVKNKGQTKLQKASRELHSL